MDRLKRACSQYFGVLGPAFIEKLVGHYSVSSLRATVQERLAQSMARLLRNRSEFNDVQRRALRRFALAEVAGLLLVDFNLVPGLSVSTIHSAINSMVTSWEPLSKFLSDEERTIRSLCDFIISNRDIRFEGAGIELNQAVSSIDKINRELCGGVDAKNGIVYVFPPAIAEATGMDATAVAGAGSPWASRERGVTSEQASEASPHGWATIGCVRN